MRTALGIATCLGSWLMAHVYICFEKAFGRRKEKEVGGVASQPPNQEANTLGSRKVTGRTYAYCLDLHLYMIYFRGRGRRGEGGRCFDPVVLTPAPLPYSCRPAFRNAMGPMSYPVAGRRDGTVRTAVCSTYYHTCGCRADPIPTRFLHRNFEKLTLYFLSTSSQPRRHLRQFQALCYPCWASWCGVWLSVAQNALLLLRLSAGFVGCRRPCSLLLLRLPRL